VHYLEVAPSPALQEWVACYWWREGFLAAEPRVQRVLPDGCADIIFDLGGNPDPATGDAFAVGTMTTPLVLREWRASELLGVRFKPGRAAAILGMPLHEITDARVPLDHLWRDAFLSEQLASLPTLEARVAMVESLLLRHITHQADRRIDAAVAGLTRGASVERVARDLAMSRQYLRRCFLEHVGIAPKSFARVMRFQRLIGRVDESTPWAALAADLGYTDQSHLIADFRAFSGLTPAAYRSGMSIE